MYICIHTYMYLHTCTDMHTYICICVYILCIYTHMYICTYIYVWILHIHLHICMRIRMCTLHTQTQIVKELTKSALCERIDKERCTRSSVSSTHLGILDALQTPYNIGPIAYSASLGYLRCTIGQDYTPFNNSVLHQGQTISTYGVEQHMPQSNTTNIWRRARLQMSWTKM